MTNEPDTRSQTTPGQNHPPVWAAEPRRGGHCAIAQPICTAPAPAFSDLHALQAEWDRAGALRRLRLVAADPVLRREWLVLPALLVVIGGTLPLLAAVLP